MARKITRGGGKKTGAKKSSSTKSAAKKSSGRQRLTLSEADVKGIAKRLRDGEKMQDIWQPMGLSTGQGIRKALIEYGFDSKGRENPDGLTARELQERARAEAKKAAPAKKASSSKRGRKAATAAASEDDNAADNGAKAASSSKRARKGGRKGGRKAATVNP